MKCDPNKVTLYWADELAPIERADVEQHVKSCWQCREVLADLQLAGRATDNIEMHTPSRDLVRAALAKAREEESGSMIPWRTVALAAAATLLLCVLVHNQQSAGPTYGKATPTTAGIGTPPTVVRAHRLAMSPVPPDMELDHRLSTVRRRMRRLRADLEPRVRRGARSGQRPNPTGVLEMVGPALRAGRVEKSLT